MDQVDRMDAIIMLMPWVFSKDHWVGCQFNTWASSKGDMTYIRKQRRKKSLATSEMSSGISGDFWQPS